MVQRGSIPAIFLAACFCGAAWAEAAVSVYELPGQVQPAGELDRLVFSRLSALGIQPTLCSDAVFVRRVYLDVIGTLPDADEAREFLRDPDVQHKRAALIDRLLERREFADYWSMKWGDALRIKAEFPVNLWPNAAQAYHRWVRASLAANKPYDQFVRELLTSSGSNFRVGPVNFYRAVQNRTPEGLAGAVGLTFLGARIDSWPAERREGFAAFFSQVGYKPTSEWKEEIVFWDPLQSTALPGNAAPGQAAIQVSLPADGDAAAQPAEAAVAQPLVAVFPDGTRATIPPDRDPREVFADWLVRADNPWFRRAIVNRVWAWLLGRGIIHEPDDIRDDNPPSNPELLAYLEQDFVDHGYDLKQLYRLILNSRTYQLSSVPRFQGPEAEAQFASYPLRRLDAEVLIDAVNKVTGTTDLYTSAIPEPFTYIPKNLPAIAIADGSITSSFLAMFGRSARATGMENERNNKPIAAQALHMLNSSHIQSKLEQGTKLRGLVVAGNDGREILENLYLTILSRFPTEAEIETALAYSPPDPRATSGKTAARRSTGGRTGAGRPVPAKRGEEWLDIAWALINSTEFLYRH